MDYIERLAMWIMLIALVILAGIYYDDIRKNTKLIDAMEHRIEQTEALLKGHLKMEH